MKRKDLIVFIVLMTIVSILGFGLYKMFTNISPALLTILAGGIGFVVSKIYESIKENNQRAYEKKREIYYKLIKPFREILFPANGKKKELTNEQIREAVEAAFDNILYASDEVIKSYGAFRNLSSNGNLQPEAVLKQFALLLQAMRKDLGNQFSTLDEVDILKMFINMSFTEEREYREKFKSIY
jgi:hypothetical protein